MCCMDLQYITSGLCITKSSNEHSQQNSSNVCSRVMRRACSPISRASSTTFLFPVKSSELLNGKDCKVEWHAAVHTNNRGNRDELSQREPRRLGAPRLEPDRPGATLTVGPVGPDAPPAAIIPLYRAHYHLESGGQLILQPRPRALVSGQWGG